MADVAAKPRTHTAFAYRREGPRMRFGRWLEVGTGRIEQPHCPNCGASVPAGIDHVFLDRLPIGAFTGYLILSPIGTQPPVPKPEPQRPGQTDDEEENSEG